MLQAVSEVLGGGEEFLQLLRLCFSVVVESVVAICP